MVDLPRLAISVRQPWAWAIIYGGKDIENRRWSVYSPSRRFTGRVAIHASSGMTRNEYREAAEFMEKLGVTCPPAVDLVRGAIIGTVEIIGSVTRVSRPTTSKWFVGRFGLVLRGPEPIPEPIPVSGQLGFFKWERNGKIMPPAKWMLPVTPSESIKRRNPEPEGNLFSTDTEPVGNSPP